MNDEEKIELLVRDGKLIKRPLLILENEIYIGIKEETWKSLLK